MREDLIALKLLRDKIVGLELQYDIILKDIDIISKDLYFLEVARQTLIDNLVVLKREKIIAMVDSYKKSTDELEYVSNKIMVYFNKLEKKKARQVRMHHELNDLTEEYTRLKEYIDSQKIVLLFDQAKRRKKIK